MPTTPPRPLPSLLRHLNERRVFAAVQGAGPLSRAEIARHTGISGPTVTRAVASLLQAELFEEEAPQRQSVGRPGKLVRLARNGVCLLAVLVGPKSCEVSIGGLDGEENVDERLSFPTPPTYEELVSACVETARRLLSGRPGRLLRSGVCVPGLIDGPAGRTLFSPNLHQIDGRQLGADLEEVLGVETTVVQECHALCLAEQVYGLARGIDNFAMMDINEGLGLGVVHGGRLMQGCRGLAGELGHVTVDLPGQPCGCGNSGCLETVATDRALAGLVSAELGRTLSIDELVEESRKGTIDSSAAVSRFVDYLGIAVAAAINIFNPSRLFIHGRCFDVSDDVFDRVIAAAKRRSLAPSFESCEVIRARGNKRLGVIAATLQDALATAPVEFDTPPLTVN